MAPESVPRTGTQAVERALAVLRVLEGGPPTMALTELARRTGLSPSTTHRLLRALCDAGLLRQNPVDDRYGFGPRLVVLGQRAAAALGLGAARPILEALATATGESVNLGLLDGDEVLVLLFIASSQRLRFDQEAGSRVPAYASAMGKVLVAFHPRPDDVLKTLPRLARITGSTITSRAALRDELDEVRARGWALNDQEREPGVRTVAAPVLTADGTAQVAIAVQGPTVRITDERVGELAPVVQAAAAEVAGQLGTAF
jgi:IclR family acetate operon transcriptional repressor